MSSAQDQGAPEVTNLTGVWVGSYFQHDRPHPIRAELVQEGERLTGVMKDDDTDRSSSVFEVAFESGLAPGADEQIVAQLRAMFPDAPPDPIHYVSHLPPGSVLEGWVRGSAVFFLKTYRGVHFGGFQVGDMVVGHRSEDHAVHYRGKLSPRGNEMEGKWWIDPTPESGGRRTEGSFTLQRQV